MNIKKIVLSTAVCLVFAGCDKMADCLPTGKERKAIERAVDESSRPEADLPVESRLAGERQAFLKYVESVSEMLAGELSAADKRLDAARADSEQLAQAMTDAAGVKTADGMPAGRKEALLCLLRDAKVNALARRYLRRSFSMEALKVEERVSAAEAETERINEEAKANAAAAAEAVNSAEEENRRARESAVAAEAKLRREIEDLAKRERRIKHELNMVSAAERIQKTRELNETRSDLRRMRREYDSMRSSSAVNREVQRASENAAYARREADFRRGRSDDRLRQAAERKQRPSDIVAEFEDGTVLALERAIADACSSAEARKARISRTVDYIKPFGKSGGEQLAVSALERMRADIDERVKTALADK